MGMKSKSNHFPKGTGGGGPSKRLGTIDLQLFAKMPKNRAQIMHIMANRPGHLADTPANRKILETLSEDKHSFIMTKNGNNIYSRIVRGKEYWVYERNGVIQNGGVNIGKFRFHKNKEK